MTSPFTLDIKSFILEADTALGGCLREFYRALDTNRQVHKIIYHDGRN